MGMAGEQATGSEDSAAGWDVINQVAARVYGGQEPRHFGAVISYRLGGNDPLDGISIYRSEGVNGSLPHWHYLTFGFSDLYGDDQEDAGEEQDGETPASGYGFELTFRLAIDAFDGDEPPAWPMNFLQNIARYVFETGNVFAPGHWMTANGPIKAGADTLITEMAFVTDPQFAAVQGPYGEVQFLQVVGLTQAELNEAKRWNARGLLQALQSHTPLWVTDLKRPSLHALPEVQAAIAEGSAREGSSTGVLYGGELTLQHEKKLLRGETITITIGALLVRDLIALLPCRLPHGKQLTATSDDFALVIQPVLSGLNTEWEDAHTLVLHMGSEPLQALLSAIQPREGEYAVPGMERITWQVRRSEILAPDGSVQEIFGAAQ